MTTWTTESVTEKLKESASWVARAIYRLAEDGDQLAKLYTGPEAKDDRTFFMNLADYFREHGHFTDRHIAIARRKIRPAYIEHLVNVANS